MSDTDSDIDTLVDDVHYAVNKETPRGDFGVKIEIFGHDGQNEHRAKHHRSGDGERAGRLAVSPRSSRVCFGEISKQPLTIPKYLARLPSASPIGSCGSGGAFDNRFQ
ncbi:hypothetical protein GCM10007919_37060 [Rhizobium indigoferae]|nr:hypothetical protein GCM10007919_37060 [Rhizobium indigoferae]